MQAPESGSTATDAATLPFPFARVLIANRGEIAVRVARACRELGVSPVAVYGPGEEDAPHVRAADDAYRLPSDAPLPYLDIRAVVEVAARAGAAAVHPGYGFLAENAAFAEACAEAGLVFVGPPPAAIRAMGEKIGSRALALAAGVPTVAGTDGPVATAEEALREAAGIGYPVAVKASGGGGGRGFRVANDAAALPDAFAGASSEAARSFANPEVYLERYFPRSRHVEIQVLAGADGEVVVLGERDCSIQRRHQKLVEETPAPGLPDATRRAMGEAAAALARAVGYRNAGTVEFLLAEDGAFFFLEMNTRIQVEHPVTEMATGIDLVKEQLRIAAGRPLPFRQEDVRPTGHAIECRINAEDPGRGFAPAPGVITGFRAPAGFGVRVETAAEAGTAILPAYDSLIAKLVVWGRDREEAIARMARALAEFTVEGVPTTLPFHRHVMAHPAFRAGEVSTAFIAEHPEVVPPPADPATGTGSGVGPDAAGPSPAREVVAEVNGRRFAVRLLNWPDPAATAAGPSRGRMGNGAAGRAPARPAVGRAGAGTGSRGVAPSANGPDLPSPIQGTVLRVAVEPGQSVRRGDPVCVVEAMKMENEVAAHRDGTVEAVLVAAGAAVRVGEALARIT
jgi:acetyl-CoA/propionyl-CoA carboxylase biotin carboxyl carrier protein